MLVITLIYKSVRGWRKICTQEIILKLFGKVIATYVLKLYSNLIYYEQHFKIQFRGTNVLRVIYKKKILLTVHRIILHLTALERTNIANFVIMDLSKVS